MKKKIVLFAGLLLCLFTVKNVKAQSAAGAGYSDVKGINLLNAGIGLGSYGLAGTGGLPITASFEHGFTKNISAGLAAGFIRQSFTDEWNYTYLIFGARGSYHFNEVLKISNPKLDVYAGAGLIYRHYKIKYTGANFDGDEPGTINYSNSASGGTVDVNLHAGARYFFGDRVGGFAELGYGISPLQLGVALKL